MKRSLGRLGAFVLVCVAVAGSISLAESAADPRKLVDASRKGLIDEVERLLAAGSKVNAPNAGGVSPLTAARLGGYSEVADLLIARGAKDSPPDPRQLVDRLLASNFSGEKPGIAVLVSQGGELLFEHAYGFAKSIGKRSCEVA